MTYKEKLKRIRPEDVDDQYWGGCSGCPSDHPELNDAGLPEGECAYDPEVCTRCWNREIPGTEPTPVIKDSGERRQFDTGAVRDIQEGKGRCDLMPLDVVSDLYMIQFGRGCHQQMMFGQLYMFTHSGDCLHLQNLLGVATTAMFGDHPTLFLEVAKHFEEGAKKYGEHNWQKGIPVKCYIDSAVRHYLKWLRGDKDEPHDRAFCWNILCAIWTCKHKPELNDYRQVKNENTCVCCGTSIPEGRQVCPKCEGGE